MNFSNYSHRYLKKIYKEELYYGVITICLVASLSCVATAQKLGESCTLNSVSAGICRHLADCSDAILTTLNGRAPTFCSFESDIPTVCCKQDSWTSRSSNYLVRYPRQDVPWWMAEKPFVETTTRRKPVRSEDLDTPWWIQDGPFQPNPSKPNVLPPTIPPQNPPPVTPPRPEALQNPERISEIKCNEYSKLTVDLVSALPLVPAPEPVPMYVPKCEFTPLELIVGGVETKPKEFPHMAALGYQEGGNVQWKCGGSLISEYYVMTAAHCSPNKKPPIIARLGELNLKRSDDGAAPVNYAIVERIRHPDYRPPGKYNDIALLKLDRRVQFNDFIRPACLYTSDHFTVRKTVATGWGRIDFAENPSDILLKVAISIIDNKVCNDLYEQDSTTRELSRGIVPTMMCAGELKGGKDTCQGDSGGPIQVVRPNNSCVYSVIGITSFGKFCAAKNAPGVYTRVSSFVPWIESIVWPEATEW